MLLLEIVIRTGGSRIEGINSRVTKRANEYGFCVFCPKRAWQSKGSKVNGLAEALVFGIQMPNV